MDIYKVRDVLSEEYEKKKDAWRRANEAFFEAEFELKQRKMEMDDVFRKYSKVKDAIRILEEVNENEQRTD